MLHISIIWRLSLLTYVIYDAVSEPLASGFSLTISPSTLFTEVPWIPANSSLKCPAACQCTVSQSSSDSRRRTAAACDRPIDDADRFDPETEIIHVTGNCHRSFVSVMTSVARLSASYELSLQRCHMYTVEELMLAGDGVNWGTVFLLDVSFNLITHLVDRTFTQMSSLRTLILKHNRIEAIDQYAFDGLSYLARLDLSENRLSMMTHADMRWLCALKSLQDLSLRDNGVHVLAAAAFRCGPTPCPLSRLDLGENRIRRVEHEAFVGLYNITQLRLDSSQLTTVPSTALVRLSASLEQLDMSGNQLNALLTLSFYNLSVLRVLLLNRMPTLQFVDRNSFVNMTALEHVELSGNEGLKYVDRETFHNTPRVAKISLSGCGLTAVDRQFIEDLVSLKSLDLRVNPIKCDCHTVWMQRSNITLVADNVWKQCKGDPDTSLCPPRIASLFDAEIDIPLTDTFTLYCRAVGSPPPQISWGLPSLLDNNSSSTEVRVAMVTVRAASSREAGNYTCRAVNNYGSDSRSVTVDVVMPPTVILVTRLTSTSATIVWKHVEHSRAYRLTYVITSWSYNQSQDRSLTNGVDVQYYMRSYTFAELRPDTTYRFCISVLPTSSDVTSGSRYDGRSLWTVDCKEATTSAARDVNFGLTDVRDYVISGCAVVVGVALFVCVVSARRRCGRGFEWPPELSDGGSSGRLSPTLYADSSADCEETCVSGTSVVDALTDEVYENVMATSMSSLAIFTAADVDEIRRTAVLSGNQPDS